MHVYPSFLVGDTPSRLYLPRVWFKVTSSQQVTQVWNFWPAKMTPFDLNSQPSPLQTSEDLPGVIEVFFPTSAVDHNVIYVSSRKVLAPTEDMIDHLLESRWSAVEPKRHDGKLKKAKRGSKCCLLPRPLSHGNLPIAIGQV